ncbi:MAG: MBL fold metallo-hydrolase [Deltaproteobacteria bacterium]|nr:MAG: MBL fold metallo-hydrolase [Deltaproteobacteria bacterium]
MRKLVLALLAAGAASAQQRDFSKVEIKTVRVAGNVYMLQGAGGNIGLTVGDDGVAMIDDQFAPLSPKIHAAIEKLSPKPVRFLINTHWHGDHVGGNALFADTAAIFAHLNVRKRMQSGGKTPMMDIPPAEAKALPIVTFEQGLSLWWNGEEIRAIHVQPGHTDGDTVIWFTKSNVVHMGDDFFATGFPFCDLDSGGSVTGVLGAIDTVLGQIPKDAKIIPGHGDVSSVDDLRKYRSSLEEMVNAVKKGLAAGKSADQLKKDKVLAAWEPAWGSGFIKADMFIDTIARDLARK